MTSRDLKSYMSPGKTMDTIQTLMRRLHLIQEMNCMLFALCLPAPLREALPPAFLHRALEGTLGPIATLGPAEQRRRRNNSSFVLGPSAASSGEEGLFHNSPHFQSKVGWGRHLSALTSPFHWALWHHQGHPSPSPARGFSLSSPSAPSFPFLHPHARPWVPTPPNLQVEVWKTFPYHQGWPVKSVNQLPKWPTSYDSGEVPTEPQKLAPARRDQGRTLMDFTIIF